jgi:glyoxylase I family protein
MKASGIHHVALNVTDIDAAIEFYTKTLGLAPRTDRPDLGFAGAWLDAGAQQVHLLEVPPPEAKGQHFALQVDDLDAAVTELRAAGVAVSDPVGIGPGRQAFLNDPSGNQIELNQPGS